MGSMLAYLDLTLAGSKHCKGMSSLHGLHFLCVNLLQTGVRGISLVETRRLQIECYLHVSAFCLPPSLFTLNIPTTW